MAPSASPKSASAAVAGVMFDDTDLLNNKKTEAACMKFHRAVVTNLESRFSDEVSSLCEVSPRLFILLVSGNFAKSL